MPPSKPRNLHVVSTDKGQINLAWDPPEEKAKAPVEGYVIEMITGFMNDFEEMAKVDGNTLKFDAVDLKPQKYNFRVKALNSAGISEATQLEKAVAACPPAVGTAAFLPSTKSLYCL